MAIKVYDMVKLFHENPRRRTLFDTSRMHMWLHVYGKPGQKDTVHCHNQDQTFYVIEGECTMHILGGEKAVLTPGMVATITGGSNYQLENSGDSPMVLMGNRSGSTEKTKTIDYETGGEIVFDREGGRTIVTSSRTS